MPRRRADVPPPPSDPIADYRHADKRKHIPPAGLAAQGKVQEVPKTRYAYDPHLQPVLRFDATGAADRLPDLLETARQRALTADEARLLADALRVREPWLEWAGKRERRGFDADPVALHIHERVAAQAILKLALREPTQRSLFADPELAYRDALRFYQHDVDWANRLILGDSLTVMASLARREDLAGKVQMIYMDPPYGIKFASNFQSQVGRRDVKDRAEDLTREPEQVRAYRDTWTLGVHSYLAYLRDRLIVARELLADTGSIFVQIGDENLHRVRSVMDEVFGPDHLVSFITFKKTGGQSSSELAGICDYLLWYCRDPERLKYRQLYFLKDPGEEGAKQYNWVEQPDGLRRPMTTGEIGKKRSGNVAVFQPYPLVSMGPSQTDKPFNWSGQDFLPSPNRHWSVTGDGLARIAKAERLLGIGNTLRFVNYLYDYPVTPFTNLWTDTQTSGFAADRLYVVQTLPTVIERCLLMTTDPGNLVLDPTAGSGTTAYVAEQWGRRWITIDTSRVAIALARQRLLTAKYDYYAIKDLTGLGDLSGLAPAAGFVYKTVPHITLKSIAQNPALDPIFARWEPILAEKLAALNAALVTVTPAQRAKLQAKLADKERREGKSAITEADRRRWLLPKSPDLTGLRATPAKSNSAGQDLSGLGWREWEVPFDTDPDWPEPLQAALTDYRQAWRGKMDEVNQTIAASAAQEELVDQPKVTPGVLRVSGPFTVEGVQPAEESLDLDSPIAGEPEDLDTFSPRPRMSEVGERSSLGMRAADEPANAEAYLDKMIRLMRADGVRFPDNKVLKFTRLEPLSHSVLHAEGEWQDLTGLADLSGLRVTVTFGPQYGPITAKQVEDCLREAYRRGYDDLVFAGFTIDGAAQAAIQDDPNPRVRCHQAHIRPDVAMGDLLKDTPGSQLFTVFGLPRVKLASVGKEQWTVEMEGVDIYDPVANTVQPTDAGKVAAWFLDSDYDGRTFCITQAFFPDASAWEKLARALKSVVDADRFAAFSGTKSLPFEAGQHGRIAVKVIDPRGNEVMRVLGLGETRY
jgi:adenine-specific DNA-methyltransferase